MRTSGAVPVPCSNIATWKWRGRRKQLGEFSHSCKVIFKDAVEHLVNPRCPQENSHSRLFEKKKIIIIIIIKYVKSCYFPSEVQIILKLKKMK